MTAKTRKFVGVKAKCMRPTLKHRPAIWECMLGTVYAMNDKYEPEYFDYDYEAARKFAGISEDRDPRLHKPVRKVSWNGDSSKGPTGPTWGNVALWILEENKANE